MKIKILRWQKITAVTLVCTFLLEMLSPVAMYAITSGPTQPEFQSFEPLGTTGMVNEFTGSFTYNIPLLEVPGPNGSSYPLTLAYHSGAAAEEDATWVGFGWTLNTGSINRGVRGFPDEYNGETITNYNRIPDDETISETIYSSLQFGSNDLKIGFEGSSVVKYNNYNGYSIVNSAAFNSKNYGAISFTSHNNARTRISIQPNWASALCLIADEAKEMFKRLTQTEEQKAASTSGSAAGKSKEQLAAEAEEAAKIRNIELTAYEQASYYISNALSTISAPPAPTGFTGYDLESKTGFTGGFIPGPILAGAHEGVMFTKSVRGTKHVTDVPSYGYLYQGSALVGKAALDYVTEREVSYNTRERYLNPAYGTPDQFICNAQGVGGNLRLVQDKPGFYTPLDHEDIFFTGNLGIETGLGPDKFSIGASILVGARFVLQNKGVRDDDQAYSLRHTPFISDGNRRPSLRFSNDVAENVKYSSTRAPSQFPVVYGLGTSLEFLKFTNTTELYDKVNNWIESDLTKRIKQSSSVRYRTNEELVLGKTGAKLPMAISQNVHSQYLDRAESAILKGIGEVTITNSAGVRHIFGLPVYSRNEHNFSFAPTDLAKNASAKNKSCFSNSFDIDKEFLVGNSKRAPYASSYLLTEVHTPDYVDRTLNGPSADDFGGYTHFSYVRAAGSFNKGYDTTSASKNWFKWRTPYTGYTYQPGKLSLSHDDRATVAMGEREVYYLSRIDTKTHVAFFCDE